MVGQFDYAGDPTGWSSTSPARTSGMPRSVAVPDAIEHEHATRGKTVEITGLTDVSGHYHQWLAGKPGGGE